MNKSSIVGSADATSQPLLDAALADLTNKVTALEAKGTQDKSTGALDVEVVSVVGYNQTKKGGFQIPTLHYLISGDIQAIKTIVVKRSEILSNSDYKSKRERTKTTDVTDADRAAGSVDLAIDPVDPSETYDVIILVGFDSFGGSIRVPIIEPDFAGYPGNALLSFTTPALTGLNLTPVRNMIEGGGMMNSFDQFSVLAGNPSVVGDQDKLGQRWDTGPASGTQIDRLAGGSIVSAGMQWLDTKGFLKMATNMFTLGGQPSCRIRKQILPGETYTFSCQLSADSAVANRKITIALYDQGTPGDIILLTTPNNWVFPVIPAWNVLIAIFQVPAGYSMAGKQWVRFAFNGIPSDVTYTTRWTLNRGESAGIWDPGIREAQLDAQSNIATPSGAGSIGSGSGGLVDLNGQTYGGGSGNLIGNFVL